MKSNNEDQPKRLAVIRIRGRVNVRKEIEDTLSMLKLHKVNHCVIISDKSTLKGMIQKAKDYITWGDVDEKDISLILKNRGELTGGEKLTDKYIKNNTKFKTINGFAKALSQSTAELDDIPSLKPVFRMHPPRKGHNKIKRSYKNGGALGPRGPRIKELIYKMR